jgi:hypothetical protein
MKCYIEEGFIKNLFFYSNYLNKNGIRYLKMIFDLRKWNKNNILKYYFFALKEFFYIIMQV